jgi:C1A family cysteine protease
LSNFNFDDESSEKNSLEEFDVDWVAWGAVGRVRDQGECNAAYAFSAAALVESVYFFYELYI